MIVALIIGELTSFYGVMCGLWLLVISIVALVTGYVCSLFTVSKYELAILGVCVGFVFIGVYRGEAVSKCYSEYDKLQYGEEAKERREFEGEVSKGVTQRVEDSYMIVGEVTDVKRNTYGYTLTLKVEDGFVYVYSDSSLSKKNETEVYSYLYGKKVRVIGDIVQMKKARNYGNYDEYTTLRSKGVLLKISAKEIYVYLNKSSFTTIYEDLDDKYISLEKWMDNAASEEKGPLTVKGVIYKLKLNMRNVLKDITTEEEYGILAAMVLGDSEEVDKDTKELYSLSGISHIMAISGLHVSLIGMGVYKLLRKRMRYVSSATISMGLMSFFLVLIGNPISAKRAVIMFVIHLIADLCGRKYDVLSALSMAAMVLLIDNPYYLMNSSFQLSFVAMIGVSVCVPIVMDFIFGGDEDKLIIEKNLWLKDVMISAMKMLAFNIVLSIILLPLNCYLFFRVSIYSPVINMIVVPLVGLVLVMVLLGMMAAIFIPSLGIFLAGTAVCILRFFTWLSRIVVSMPYSSVLTGKLTFGEIIFCYLLLGLCIFILADKTSWHSKRQRFVNTIKESKKESKIESKIVRKKYWCKWMCVAFFMSTFFIIIFREKYNGFSICFLDVGQGAAIYMKSEEGNDYLIDGGSSDEKNIGEYKLESFLEARQVDKLEYVFVTHCDTDHISGIVELIERKNILIDNLILPDIPGESRDEKYLELEALARKQGINVLYMKAGDKLKDGELKITCINPGVVNSSVMENLTRNEIRDVARDEIRDIARDEIKDVARNTTTDINESSLVFVAEYKSLAAVFTGDIGKETERELINILEQYDFDRRTVIYDVAHHGSRNSNSEELIGLLKPTIAVVSCGKDNSYGHPAVEVLERLKEVGCSVWCTYESGQIEVYEEEEKIRIRGMVVEE